MNFQPDILHKGCDGLTVALMGKLPFSTLERLDKIKVQAGEAGHDVGEEIGGVDFNIMQQGTSAKQGYSFQFHTGRDGIKYQAKKSGDSSQWNLRARVSALYLAQSGFAAAHKQIYADLYAMGAVVIEESVSDVDFCVDIRMDAEGTPRRKAFQLEPAQFVHHSKMKRRQFYSNVDLETNDLSILGGRYVETVTLGGRGSRQLCVYNKRTEQVAKRRGDWFEVWGKDKEDCPNVWRVEFRFGRTFLREWNIKDLNDVHDSFGDLIKDSLGCIRYIDGNDSNRSRAANHTFWDLAEKAFDEMSIDHVSGLVRGRVSATQKDDLVKMYEGQMLGIMAGLCEANGLSDTDEIKDEFLSMISDLVTKRMTFEPDKFNKSRRRTRDKYINLRTKEA